MTKRPVKRIQIAKLVKSADAVGTRAPFIATREVAEIVWHALNRAVFHGKLTFPDNISIRESKEKWWGVCVGMQRGNRAGPYYTKVIRLQRYWPNPKKFITTMAHEMVHQYEWEMLHDMTHGKTFFAWSEKLKEKGICLSISL